jgi:hypothetical protein
MASGTAAISSSASVGFAGRSLMSGVRVLSRCITAATIGKVGFRSHGGVTPVARAAGVLVSVRNVGGGPGGRGRWWRWRCGGGSARGRACFGAEGRSRQ